MNNRKSQFTVMNNIMNDIVNDKCHNLPLRTTLWTTKRVTRLCTTNSFARKGPCTSCFFFLNATAFVNQITGDCSLTV